MNNMIIRKSTFEDMDRIMEIFQDARAFMKEMGNPTQWGDGNPNKSVILHDIENGHSCVCLRDGYIVGTFFYKIGEEPNYKEIFHGQWLNDEPYGVVHRVAAAKGTKGVGSFLLDWCYERLANVKIDTHKDNIPMQKLLEKKGFKRCGIIYVEDGSERIAYQKTE